MQARLSQRMANVLPRRRQPSGVAPRAPQLPACVSEVVVTPSAAPAPAERGDGGDDVSPRTLLHTLPPAAQHAVIMDPRGTFPRRFRAAEACERLLAIVWCSALSDVEATPTLDVHVADLPYLLAAAATGALRDSGARGLRVHRWGRRGYKRDVGLAPLFATLSLMPWLEVLDISATSICRGCDVAALYKVLRRLPHLRHLRLPHVPLRVAGSPPVLFNGTLCEVTQLSSMQSLAIEPGPWMGSQGPLSAEVTKPLRSLTGHAPQLTRLQLSDIQGRCERDECVAAVASVTQLRELRLRLMPLTWKRVLREVEAAVRALTGLESLQLQWCTLTAAAMERLWPPLGCCSRLTELDLHGNDINIGSPCLAACARLRSLAALQLGGGTNALVDGVDGSPLSQLTALAMLQLPAASARVTIASELFAPLCSLPRLRHLCAQRVQGSASHLAPLLSPLTQLTYLSLHAGNCSQDAQAQLLAALPQLQALADFTMHVTRRRVRLMVDVPAARAAAKCAFDLPQTLLPYFLSAGRSAERSAEHFLFPLTAPHVSGIDRTEEPPRSRARRSAVRPQSCECVHGAATAVSASLGNPGRGARSLFCCRHRAQALSGPPHSKLDQNRHAHQAPRQCGDTDRQSRQPGAGPKRFDLHARPHRRSRGVWLASRDRRRQVCWPPPRSNVPAAHSAACLLYTSPSPRD